MLTRDIFRPLTNLKYKNIRLYLCVRYLALFISVYLTFQTLDLIKNIPLVIGIMMCCLYIIVNYLIYVFYKKIISIKCIFSYLLERFWLNNIFLFTLLILNLLCLYYLEKTFIDFYKHLIYIYIFISPQGFFYEILYTSGGNPGTGGNAGGNPGTGGNAGGNPGPNGNPGGPGLPPAMEYVYSRYGSTIPDITEAVYNPHATGFPTLAAYLHSKADYVERERAFAGENKRSVSLADIDVDAS